jgi:hypothetical protein
MRYLISLSISTINAAPRNLSYRICQSKSRYKIKWKEKHYIDGSKCACFQTLRRSGD